MRKSVVAAWYPSIKGYEGYTNYMYFDTHKPPLCTTGVGNMIDTGTGLSAFGLSLPWRFSDTTFATEAQIKEEYNRLKGLGIQAQGGYAYKDKASLFLDESVVKWMVMLKTDEFWATLARAFPDIEKWPADAQLAIMNMAWWMGPAFTKSWPTLTAALKAQDFTKASKNCTTVNPSQRNPDNVKRFQNAAAVVAADGDREILYDLNKTPPKPPVVVKPPVVNKPPVSTVKVDVSNVLAAKPSVVNADAKRVQMMLKEAGFYTLAVDGLFGNISKGAFVAWAKANKQPSTAISKATLQVLSDQTLHYTVVA